MPSLPGPVGFSGGREECLVSSSPALASGKVRGPFWPQVATETPSKAVATGIGSRLMADAVRCIARAKALVRCVNAFTGGADCRPDGGGGGASDVVAGADGAFQGEHFVHVLVDLRTKAPVGVEGQLA